MRSHLYTPRQGASTKWMAPLMCMSAHELTAGLRYAKQALTFGTAPQSVKLEGKKLMAGVDEGVGDTNDVASGDCTAVPGQCPWDNDGG